MNKRVSMVLPAWLGVLVLACAISVSTVAAAEHCTAAQAVAYCVKHPAVRLTGVASTGCVSFYNCAGSQSVCQPCGPGLRFNTRLQVCDFARNVDKSCNGGVAPPGPPPPPGPLPAPPCSPKGAVSYCRAHPLVKVAAVPATKCTKYFTCAGAKSTCVTCPKGRAVLLPTATCALAALVNKQTCKKMVAPPRPPPPAPCSPKGAVSFCRAHPLVKFAAVPATTCTKYFKCAGSKSTCVTCPKGRAVLLPTATCALAALVNKQTCKKMVAPPRPGPPPLPPRPPPPPPHPTAGGVSYTQFSCVFLGDSSIQGGTNTKAIVDKHWLLFSSAVKALSKTFSNNLEAAAFFGHVKHEYGGYLNHMVEYCAAGACTCCDTYQSSWCNIQAGSGKSYYGRGPLQLTWPCNYKAMGDMLGVDLLSNPDVVASPSSNVGWQSAIGFWAFPDFNCAGLCPGLAADGKFGATTSKINPIECGNTDNQNSRVQKYQQVRPCFSLGAETNTAWLKC